VRNQTQLFSQICLGLPPLPPSSPHHREGRTMLRIPPFWIITLFHWVQLSRVLGPVDPWRWRHCFLSKRREPITQWGSVTPQKKRNLNHAAMSTSHNSHSLNFPPEFCLLRPPPSSPSRWAGPKYALKSYDYWVMTTFVMAAVGRYFGARTAVDYHRKLN